MENAAPNSLNSVAVRKNGLEFNVAVNHRIDFWRRLENNVWEPGTFKVFDHFLDRDTTYIDIGAWIGPTLLYAAQRSKASYAFEPDPVAFEELSRNLRSNDEATWRRRIQIYHQAVDHQAGTLRLGNPSGGGNSMTSVLFSGESSSWEVEKISLADFFAEHDLRAGKVFVKMDIEGGEYQLLPHLRELFSQPDLVLYLSVHPWLLGLLALNLPDKADHLPSKIRRRLLIVARHLRLLRALPFRHLYHENGRPISLTKETLRAIVSGNFTTTLVATHTPWEAFGGKETAQCE
ncbi:MAG: FkbM family methyltransferase [Blastocatellales bacterium]